MPTLHLGDDINTDDIIPAQRGTNADPAYLAHYAFEHLIGAGQLSNYRVIEAGNNFGCGSSREFAPIAIKAAGIELVRAKSFAEIFYRNSLNIGLPLEQIGEAKTASSPVVTALLAAGGLLPLTQKRLNQQLQLPPSQTAARPMTLAEKLLARASGNRYVRPGEVVFARVDLAMSHDAIAGPVAQLFHRQFGLKARLWDTDRVVLVADHFIQISEIRPDSGAEQMRQQMVEFAQEQGCHLFDIVSPGEAAGICHVLLPERGFIRPGMVIAGTDSHSCTYGALGCFSTGVGTTDMASIFAAGELWIRVPETLRIELSGTLPPELSAKDIMLFILGELGCDGATGKVIEFGGSVIAQLNMDERMTLSNMTVECGAVCGLMPVDAVTRAYLESRTKADWSAIVGDPDAEYVQTYSFDLSELKPQVACPPKPDQVMQIADLKEVPITRAFIGSCTGGKLSDLAQAAAVLKGQRVAPEVSLFVVPASQEIRQQAESLGYLDTFSTAGGQVLKSGCGACINAGQGVLGKAEVGIYATNRNFKGRSGDPSAQNYLASPRSVAISAVRGKIADRLV
ncbi:3-isopropylmalate dehydratase large subunit [Romeria aff. gracilis LEGE 07310]|uniref:3-isopropylmalate dehydratase large subunit n=1 Tax=Vasconcelosia minhoensis LEGE 07310 TaxID=915328 RepID=A0A8J7AJ26_9CYAN|nr:3-isopropylmalate dehydratase large subunit [Romeria aff. gracilis LEGE 07310]